VFAPVPTEELDNSTLRDSAESPINKANASSSRGSTSISTTGFRKVSSESESSTVIVAVTLSGTLMIGLMVTAFSVLFLRWKKRRMQYFLLLNEEDEEDAELLQEEPFDFEKPHFAEPVNWKIFQGS